MPMKALWKLNGLLIIALLAGCGYAVSVNDNVVYTPPKLFTGQHITDKNLAACVEQTILDQEITEARNLKRLNCTNAGISSLAGLEIFAGLEELNLADNALQNIEELKHLAQLRVLILTNNSLQNVAPLLTLLKLYSLDLAGNAGLSCNDLKQLEKNWAELSLTQSTTLIKPEHCG